MMRQLLVTRMPLVRAWLLASLAIRAGSVPAAVFAEPATKATARHEPLVIEAAKIGGEKARLGKENKPLVVLDERAIEIKTPAAPGRVLVRAYFKHNGQGKEFLRSQVHLAGGPGQPESSRTSAACPASELAAGSPLELRLVHGSGNLALSISRALSPAARTELSQLKGKSLKPTIDDKKAKDVPEDAAEDLLGEGDKLIDAVATTVPMLLLERIEIVPESGSVVIARVASDRITYAPGGTAQVTVALENLTAAPLQGKLSVVLVSGLRDRKVVATESLTASGKTERTFAVPLGNEEWGRGIEVEFSGPSGNDRATHALSVVTHPYQVAFHGRGLPMFGSELWSPEQAQKYAEDSAASMFANYQNVYEAFAWAPCDYSEMTPDTPSWRSGQTQYSLAAMPMKTLHKVYHDRGIHAISYGKASAGGYPGLEYGRLHPEQMNVFSPAGFAHEFLSVDVIDRMRENRYRSHGKDEDFWQMWIPSWLQIGNLDAANYGCDEIIRSAKMLDWDGVRWDGHFNYWQDPLMSARTVRHTVERMQGQRPGFAIGYNYMGPQHSLPEVSVTEAELAACAHDRGLIMTEYYRNLIGPVRACLDQLQWAGDATRAQGGLFLAIMDDLSHANQALVFAGGARPMGGGPGSTFLNKFGTRFSQFVFDPTMRRLETPQRVIEPVANADFLWDSFVYEKRLDERRSQLILQLVNVSESLTFHGQTGPPTGLNPTQRDVRMALKLPAGYTAKSVFASDDYVDGQPQAATLQKNDISIPRVRLWTLVVVDLERATPTADLAKLCRRELVIKERMWDEAMGQKLLANLKSDDKELRAAVAAGKTRIEPEVLQAIFALGPPASSAPGELVYKQTDWSAPVESAIAAAADAKTADLKKLAAGEMPFALRRNGRLDIHYVRGVYYYYHRLDEAFAGLQNVHVTSSSLDDGRNACSAPLAANNTCALSGYPTAEQLAGIDIVVIDNSPAAGFTQQQRHELKQFVAAGGSLLVLGGWHSLSKGSYEGSFIEEILPIRCRQSNYLLRLKPQQQAIEFTAAGRKLLGAAGPLAGSVEWINRIEPRADAEVLLTAGGNPVLVSGKFGKGRAIACALSSAGDPKSPYWENAAWPPVMRAVLESLSAGADETTPIDPAAVRAADAAIAKLDEQLLLGEGPTGKLLPAELKKILDGGRESDALFAASVLLAQASSIDPQEYPPLAAAIIARIGADPGWAKVGKRHLDNPPPLLEKLVALIAAQGVRPLSYRTLLELKDVDEVTRLRAIAASADPAAADYLRQQLAVLDKQEQAAAVQSTTPVDLYRTHLLRPYVAYALLRCGQRDEATLAEFCRSAAELPFYAWRQRWVMESAWGAVQDATRTENRQQISEAKTRVRNCEQAIEALDEAAAHVATLLDPDVLGRDVTARRAAAGAFATLDCHRSLPMLLAYLEQIPAVEIGGFAPLQDARLDSLRYYMANRIKSKP